MKNKNLLYIVGAVVIVGGIIMYNRYQKRKKSEMNAGSLEEEMSGFIEAGQQIGTTSCSNPDNSVCQKKCEDMGGVFNSDGTRRCFKNGQPISGGVFGGRGRAVNKAIR